MLRFLMMLFYILKLNFPALLFWYRVVSAVPVERIAAQNPPNAKGKSDNNASLLNCLDRVLRASGIKYAARTHLERRQQLLIYSYCEYKYLFHFITDSACP